MSHAKRDLAFEKLLQISQTFKTKSSLAQLAYLPFQFSWHRPGFHTITLYTAIHNILKNRTKKIKKKKHLNEGQQKGSAVKKLKKQTRKC